MEFFSTQIASHPPHRCMRAIRGIASVSSLVLAVVLSSPAFAGEAEHYEAALSVVVLPSNDELSRLSDALADDKIRSNPRLRHREQELRDLLADLYQSDELKSRTARVYMQHFNEDELRQLAKLIRDPVVVKYRRITPTLYRQMADIERELYERRLQPSLTAQRSDRTTASELAKKFLMRTK